LNAPALADDSNTARASAATCQPASVLPPLTAIPAKAQSMIAKLMRSLKRLQRFFARTGITFPRNRRGDGE
jgi:hypothetical protein